MLWGQTVQHRVTWYTKWMHFHFHREGKKDVVSITDPLDLHCWPLMPDSVGFAGLFSLRGILWMVLKLGNISLSHPQKTHSAKKLRSQERRQPDLRSDEETTKKPFSIGLRNSSGFRHLCWETPAAESPGLWRQFRGQFGVGLWCVWVGFCIRPPEVRTEQGWALAPLSLFLFPFLRQRCLSQWQFR